MARSRKERDRIVEVMPREFLLPRPPELSRTLFHSRAFATRPRTRKSDARAMSPVPRSSVPLLGRRIYFPDKGAIRLAHDQHRDFFDIAEFPRAEHGVIETKA